MIDIKVKAEAIYVNERYFTDKLNTPISDAIEFDKARNRDLP